MNDKLNSAELLWIELNSLCSNSGIGFGLLLEDALCNHCRDPKKMLKELSKLRKKYKIRE